MAGSRRSSGYVHRWLYASQTDKDLDMDLAAVEDRLDALDVGTGGGSVVFDTAARKPDGVVQAGDRADSGHVLALRVFPQGSFAPYRTVWHRDPRGQTLSVAMWAVADHPDEAPDYVQWHPVDDVPPLAFDHNAMVEFCRPLLVDRLWRDLTFTRALTGPTFPVSAAVAITRSLTGVSPDRGNLNRRLASVRGLGISHKRVVLGRGRPGTLWEWQSSHMEPEAATGAH